MKPFVLLNEPRQLAEFGFHEATESAHGRVWGFSIPRRYPQYPLGMSDANGQRRQHPLLARHEHDRIEQHGQHVGTGQDRRHRRQRPARKGNAGIGDADIYQDMTHVLVERARRRQRDRGIGRDIGEAQWSLAQQRMMTAAGNDISSWQHGYGLEPLGHGGGVGGAERYHCVQDRP